MSEHDRSRLPRKSFRSRMWILLGVSIIISMMLWIPEVMRDWILNARVNEMKRQIDDAAQRDDPLNAISAQLVDAGFTEQGRVTTPPQIQMKQDHAVLAAELHLSDGTPFWRPMSVLVFAELPVHEDIESPARIDFWYPWPRPTQTGRSSRWDRILPTYSILLPFAVIVTIILRVNQRDMRVRRGQCRECGYPIGTSQVCTECGAAVSKRPVNSSRV